MYALSLMLHSLLRWAVLALAAAAVVSAWSGWLSQRPFGPGARRIGTLFVAALDLQLLMGLVLYGLLSPISRAALGAPGAAMRDRQSRYWLVEHPGVAVLAVVLAHLGQALSKRAQSDGQRWRRAAFFFAAAAALLAATVPWPWLAVGRPLWRL
jgi:hypothetical protein